MKKRLDIVYCPDDLKGLNDTLKCFLAGPIQGGPNWQHEIPKISGVTWICPRRLDYNFFNYDEQVSWETMGLRISDFILFWIPAPSEDIPGRGYAQTTRIEFGENLARGKKIVAGCYPEYNGRKYLAQKLKDYTGQELHETLEETISELKSMILGKQGKKTWFTSDTHFSQNRTLELSKRPFKSVEEMDWKMIENWNNLVGPEDTVYHLGDFGESWPIEYLNGHIKLVPGNYERSGNSPVPPGVEVLGDTETINLNGRDYLLTHEPTKVIDGKTSDARVLFGHIHGRQKVKRWDGLDVGVDGNNFSPVSLSDVEFYLNAIEKGYYDEEVWC